MDIRPIRSDDDLTAALREVERLWNAAPGTPDADKMEVLVTLIQAFENEHHPIPDADPIDLILHAMEVKGRTQKDLAALLGSKSRASEILRRRRPLTMAQAYKINREWGIPADALIVPYHIEKAA